MSIPRNIEKNGHAWESIGFLPTHRVGIRGAGGKIEKYFFTVPRNEAETSLCVGLGQYNGNLKGIFGKRKPKAEGFAENDLGQAVMNRLKKAAGWNIITP